MAILLFEVLFVVLQALFVAFWAAGATAIVLGTWPSPPGTLGVFLLYLVVGAFIRFVSTISQSGAFFGRPEFDIPFVLVFILLIIWAHAEFLRPPGYPRITFNQASTIFLICGLAIGAFDYLHPTTLGDGFKEIGRK